MAASHARETYHIFDDVLQRVVSHLQIFDPSAAGRRKLLWSRGVKQNERHISPDQQCAELSVASDESDLGLPPQGLQSCITSHQGRGDDSGELSSLATGSSAPRLWE